MNNDRTRLRKIVARADCAAPALPYVHNSDFYGLVNVLEDRMIAARECHHFNHEPLIYLFYGRPSYRVNPNEEATGLNHYLPVCFVIKNSAITKIKRAFPFDSGGFFNDIYADALHRHMKVGDFGLEPDPTTPGRVVSLFFGSVANYLNARAGDVTFDSTEMEANSYKTLITNKMGNSGDNRISGIEVQIDSNIETTDILDAIIVPSVAMDSASVVQASIDLKFRLIPYSIYNKMRPSDYAHPIFDTCFRYYREIGVLK